MRHSNLVGEKSASSSFNSIPRGLESNPLDGAMSFATWAICLPRWILATKTPFSWALLRSFSARRWTGSPSTTTFPLPAPYPGCFGSGMPISRSTSFQKVAMKRLLHIIVCVLDFLYLGRFPNVRELERRPNGLQRAAFKRLWSLLVVCSQSQEEFPMVPGRSGPELGAALVQLEEFLAKHHSFHAGYKERHNEKFEENPHLLPSDKYPQLQPYKNLDVSRLKIVGNGSWPMMDFIDGPLWLPYQEPSFLLHGFSTEGAPGPSFKGESRDENLALARIWDARGILYLCGEPTIEGHFSRVFNAHKSDKVDRQIGDRRIPNQRERHIDGPSRHLPPGFMLTSLRVRPFVEQLTGSVTDRRDFYHQALVTPERARSNMLPFDFSLDELRGLQAASGLAETSSRRQRRRKRENVGDDFGLAFGHGSAPDHPGSWYPCFASLFQGDHLGVEFALKAHEGLLVDGGLLCSKTRLLGHEVFPLSSRWEGLIIDDYFAISAEPTSSSRSSTFSFSALKTARDIYSGAHLIGSPEKDIEAENDFKAAGAEITSNDFAVSKGITTVAAPLAKRLALSLLSLRTASLGYVTSKLAARLAGNWVSVLLYRRCLTCVVDDLFALGTCGPQDSQRNEIFKMPKKVAQELQMLAALAPLISTNIAVNYLETAFAVDASLGKGAVVSTPIDPELSELLWLGSDKRGGYCLLDEPAKHLQAAAGIEIDYGLHGYHQEEEQTEGPFKAPLLYFDFVEFCGGSGRVTACCHELGLSVAPPLDLSNSRHYDMTDMRFLEWALFMIQEKRFRSFMLAPPCTTFSPAAWPAVRSYAEPLGFDRTNEKTFLGNSLSFKSFILMRAGKRAKTPNMLEQPRRSKMAWLRFWRNLLELGFAEAVVASCQFGSPHKKEFRLLTYLIDCSGLEVRCPGGHNHLKVEGKFTKASAIYTWDLARHFARSFANSLHLLEAAEAFDGKPIAGLESTVLNDILTSRQWSPESCWSWKRRSHINVLEANAAVAMLEKVARSYCEVRFPALMDSRVAKCVLAKGRSTARSLQPACRRAGALQFAFGLYPGWDFAPTRLNPADDPTRLSAIRAPSDRSWTSYCSNTTLQKIHHVRLSRWSANWLRLCLLLLSSGAQACEVPASALSPLIAQCSRSSPTAPWIPTATEAATLALSPVTALYFWILSVDAWISVAFGCSWTFLLLLLIVSIVGVFSVWSPLSRCCLVPRSSFGLGPRSKRWCALTLLFALSIPAVEAPMAPTTATETRRAATRHQTELIATRVLRKKTLEARQELLNEVQDWLAVEHNVMLTQLLTAKPPDAEEICRWLVGYGKVLFQSGKAYGRFAEANNAVAAAHPRSAKHQTARLYPLDIVQLLQGVYQRVPEDEELWPYSSATLRKRFNNLLTEHGLPTNHHGGSRPFDLGSLRPGGATHLLVLTESPDLVRRRGRWTSNRVREIYLQEVIYTTFTELLNPQVKKPEFTATRRFSPRLCK